MFSQCSNLLRTWPAGRKWADESGEETGAGEKLLAVLLSVGLAGVVTVAVPLALLHLR